MITSSKFNFPPSFIGFDHLWDDIERATNVTDSFPRHNLVEVDEDNMVLEMALAGYSEKDISVKVEENLMTIESKKEGKDERKYLHKGISARSFKKQFKLGEHVVVDSADFIDGMLCINLKVVVPEEKKPREIPILRKGTPELLTE